MNLKNNLPLQQKLASEYVLGTLRGGARRRFETLLAQDPALHQVVREWEAKLLPMAEFAKSAQPSPQVWNALEKRLGLKQSDRLAYWRNLREDLAFWRGLGLVSTTAALLMVSVLLSKQTEQVPVPPPVVANAPSANYVATLSDDKAQPVAVITGDTTKHQLTVKIVTAQNLAADKSFELWAVGKDGKVKSLGLVAANGVVTLPLPTYMNATDTPLLAVTLEPKGGSGNPEKPTGPIVFKGNWLSLG